MLGCKRLKRMRKMTASGFGLKWHMWPFILPKAWGKNCLSRAKSNLRLSDSVIQCYDWATENSVVDYGSSMFIFDKHPAHCYGQKCWKPLAKWSRKESKEHINPFIPKRNWLLIYLGSITAESSTKVMRIKEMIINSRCSWLLKKILLSYHRKCIENSMENMNTDARV